LDVVDAVVAGADDWFVVDAALLPFPLEAVDVDALSAAGVLRARVWRALRTVSEAPAAAVFDDAAAERLRAVVVAG